ncbi:MAG: amidohydrolase family protein [Spirochaetes bacterium]|nr:amidohydrolase family protein [Spirochaetota bacterium]
MNKNRIVICATTLFDGKSKSKSDNVYITVEGDKIVEVSKEKKEYDFFGVVTPAFIDAHSHIGMERQGEPYQEGETNDHSGQIQPTLNPLNSIYFDDRAFEEAVDFGVLYSCIVPGSGNILGGKAFVIKNFSKNRRDAVIKDYGYKMALGYNPRSTTSWKGERPNTRMGVYSLIEDKFDTLLNKKAKALLSKEKKINELENKIKEKNLDKESIEKEKRIINTEYELEFSPEDLALLEILERKKTVKVHVHKEDDALYLIDIVKKYNIKVTADHVCDVTDIDVFNELAKAGIDVVYGPLGSLDYKVELKHAHYSNTKNIMDSKAFFGLMTDHPVILSSNLRESLKYFLIQGMSEETAISLITYKNAKILGLEDELGAIETGKTASLIVWNNNPFYLGAYPEVVIGEGKILRNKKL